MGTPIMRNSLAFDEKAIGKAARQLPRSSKPPSKSERAPVHEPVASAHPGRARGRGGSQRRQAARRGGRSAGGAVVRRLHASAGRLEVGLAFGWAPERRMAKAARRRGGLVNVGCR